MPDGSILSPSGSLVSERGRKITILGSTNDPSSIATFAQDSDFLIHECGIVTQYVSRLDEEQIAHKVTETGHSTEVMAACFAQSINARNLVFTNLSQGFPDPTRTRLGFNQLKKLVEKTKSHFRGAVHVAHDGLLLPIPPPVGE